MLPAERKHPRPDRRQGIRIDAPYRVLHQRRSHLNLTQEYLLRTLSQSRAFTLNLLRQVVPDASVYVERVFPRRTTALPEQAE